MPTGLRPSAPAPERPASADRLLPALLVYLALGLLLLGASFQGWHRVGAKDWNWFLGQMEAEVTSLRDYGQFPGWMPWRHGGQVAFGQPESMALSPVLPLALLVGTLAAFKLLLVPIFVAGCLGMHALAGRIGLTGGARLVPALVLFSSSAYPLYVVGGLPNWLFALGLLPWLLWALLVALEDLRFVVVAAACLAGLMHCGALYHFVFAPVFLGCAMVALSIVRRSPRPLLVLAAVLVVTVGFTAPRLLPTYELYGLYSRRIPESFDFLTPAMAVRAFLDPHLPPLAGPRDMMIVLPETGINWIYVGSYVGPVAVLCAVFGALSLRRAAPWLLAGGASLWLTFGDHATPSLWAALRHLPVFGSMHYSQRLIVFASLALAVLAGLGFQRLQAWLARPWMRGAALAALVLPPLLVNLPIASHAFPLEPLRLPRAAEFRQQFVKPRPEQYGGNIYDAVLANIGNPAATTDLLMPSGIVVADSPEYRGEVYLRDGHGSVRASLTPNEIRVHASVEQDDRLMVNQNFYPGWVAGGSVQGPLQDQDHLLSLPLPAGEHELLLRYAPTSVRRGFLIGGAALLLSAAWLWVRRRRAVTAVAGPELLALLGAFTLAAIVGRPRPSPELPPPPSPLQGALVVDASQTGSGVWHEIQPAIDAASPGAVVLVRPGAYAGFRLAKPLVIIGGEGGSIELRGPVEVTGIAAGERACLEGLSDEPLALAAGLSVHDCAGAVILQNLRLDGSAEERPAGGAPATGALLAIHACASVHLIGCALEEWSAGGRAAALSVIDGNLVTVRCDVRAGPRPAGGPPEGAAGLLAERSLVLLGATEVAGGAGAARGGPALRATASHVVVSGAPEQALRGGAGSQRGAPLVLAEHSDAVVSGVQLDPDAPSVDERSTLERLAEALPRVSVVQSRFLGLSLRLDLQGRPGSSAVLVIGALPTLSTAAGSRWIRQVDMSGSVVTLPVQIPASGQLTLTTRVPTWKRTPGTGAFVQLAVPARTAQAPGDVDLSLLDGSLFELREP